MNEQYYDAVLHIKTVGEQKGFNKSMHYHRYEPTPYSGLDELLNQYEIRSSDRIVDFGCGKGRLNFYMHHKCGASAVGIELAIAISSRSNRTTSFRLHFFAKFFNASFAVPV